uniref:C-type lectin domain-containing protein n=1 Tax=Cyprinus carpio TaxID=7962 RepID=A0A8C2I7E3_CYPCA
SGLFTLTLCAPQFVFVNESKTWAEAQRYCRDKYTDLATIGNEQQTVQLLDTVNDDSIDLAWIGLYDDLNSWKWTLEDSDFFSVGEKNFRNWYDHGPGNSGAQSLCVYIYYGICDSGKWMDENCNYAFPFICHSGE